MNVSYVYLLIAIFMEVTGTTFMKRSEGFTVLIPSIITVVAYAISFYCLSLTLKSIPTGVAYAIWSGVGIVLIAMAAWIFNGQKLDAGAIAGMALIASGVIVMNVFSNSAVH